MFSLDSVLDDLWPQARPAPWQKSLLKRLLHEDEFQQFAASHRHLKGLDMVEQVLEHLDILCTISARDLEQIPEHGPLIVIANHPTGTLDGLALLYAVSRVRRDVKVVTNRMLSHLEPLSSLFIPVDNMGGRTAKASLVQMEQHLQNAGVLIFFPAGEVSRPTRKGIRDKKWHPGFIKLASKLRVPLLPVHIQAHNSLLFYASTLVSPTVSLLLLMQQMFRRRHSQLPIKIGQQIAWNDRFSSTLSSREMAEQCRQHVIRLGKGLPGVFKTQCAIARPEDRATLKRELAQAECLGKTSDGKTIYLWQRNGQEEAPLLRELGRLREIAFRAVEEGSGKRRDTDSYDDDYLHLILWDDDDLEIVGAYRFMPTHYRYLFGPVSISGGLPPAARDLLVAFYRLWFPASHPLAASRQPYPASLPDVLAQFSGVDYVDDLTKLKSLLGNLGCGIPPLYKQYSELCEPGGVQFIDFGSDPAFNNCIDGLVLVDLCYLKANRYQRYIEAHLIPSPLPSP